MALKFCQQDKIHKQLTKEKALNRKELSFFVSNLILFVLRPLNQSIRQNLCRLLSLTNPNQTKSLAKEKLKKPRHISPPNQDTKLVYFRCKKLSHIAKYCRLNQKLRNLDI